MAPCRWARGRKADGNGVVGHCCIEGSQVGVCGTDKGASVWDAELHEKLIEVKGTETVSAVDVSPDSARFAAGTEGDCEASIWSMSSGKRLVGPLKHDKWVTGIVFSPDGEHVTTACYGGSVRIFGSHNGDEVITIATISPSTWPNIPLVWSNDVHQIFATSDDDKVRSFAVSTGSQIAESPILSNGHRSVALAPNGTFIATYARRSISFLDTSTLSLVVPVIDDSKDIFSIAISPDGNYLATGQDDGRLIVRNLSTILPDSYRPVHVAICPYWHIAPLTCNVRHLLLRENNQTSCFRPRPAMTTNHLVLTR